MSKISKLEPRPGSKVKLTLELEPQEVEAAERAALTHLKSQLELKGFRKGLAPEALVREAVGEARLVEEALKEILRTSYPAALEGASIVPLGEPSVALETQLSLSPPRAFRYTVEIEIYPKVLINNYQEIRVKKGEPKSVSDLEVSQVVEEIRARLADRTVKTQAAAAGDLVEIDFVGKVDGLAEDRLQSKNHPVWLGKTELVPGFTEALVGLKAGERKEFPISYPLDHPAKDIAGRTVEFAVEIRRVESVKLPVVDDQLAEKVGFKSLLELRARFRENLAKEKAEAAKLALESRIIDELLKRTEVELPETLISQQIDQLIEALKKDIERIGGNFLQYLEHRKLSPEAFRDSLRPRAEQEVKIGLALVKVAEEEGIKESQVTSLPAGEAGHESPEERGHDHSGLFRAALDRLVTIATSNNEVKITNSK